MAIRTTLEQHTLQQPFADATSDFAWLLSGSTLAGKVIEARIRTAGLNNAYGAAGAENVQGEQQQKLDVYANDCMMHCLGACSAVAALVSEEDEEPVLTGHAGAQYIVIFDPLDGSSNIDVNVNVGTIFSIHKQPAGMPLEQAILQPGTAQVAAGYVVYGPSTVCVFTTGHGVDGFTLDPATGSFQLSHPDMRMPAKGPYYSVNEANAATWPEGYEGYVQAMRDTGYSSRYIGSLVADFHRTLLKGGVFLYPPTKKQPGGKLRLLYEANPLSMLAEQSGGKASSGKGRVLELQPEKIHQRTPFMVGSATEIDAFEKAMGL